VCDAVINECSAAFAYAGTITTYYRYLLLLLLVLLLLLLLLCTAG